MQTISGLGSGSRLKKEREIEGLYGRRGQEQEQQQQHHDMLSIAIANTGLSGVQHAVFRLCEESPALAVGLSLQVGVHQRNPVMRLLGVTVLTPGTSQLPGAGVGLWSLSVRSFLNMRYHLSV